jgi:hypothetical protein
MSREEKGNEETREMELAHKVRRTKDMGKGKKAAPKIGLTGRPSKVVRQALGSLPKAPT